MNDELKALRIRFIVHRSYFLLSNTEGHMSDKERQKKDGQRKDKKNQRMRERENEVVQEATAPQQARDASNLTDTQPGAAGTRTGGNKGR
jgi:hypothetical protein